MLSYLDKIRYVNGPYERCDDERWVVVVTYKEGRRRTVSYPKFLVEVLLGRELDPHKETVDHIDHDWTNNAWDNLRIVPRGKHVQEDAKRVKLVQVVCLWCKEEVYKSASIVRHNRKKGKAGPFCGNQCAGAYRKAVQTGKADPEEFLRKSIDPSTVNPQYYFVTKSAGPTVLDVASKLGLTLYSEEEIVNALPRYKKRTKNARPVIQRAAKTKRTCIACGKRLKGNSASYCSTTCRGDAQRKISWPSREELRVLVWKYPTTYIAKRYGVSDNAVAKWCKKYGIEKPPRGYWSKKKSGKV